MSSAARRPDTAIRLSAAVCQVEDALVHGEMTRAIEIREVILMVYLFDSYPAALDGFRILAGIAESDVRNVEELKYTPENIENETTSADLSLWHIVCHNGGFQIAVNEQRPPAPNF